MEQIYTGVLYFVATDVAHGTELWKSNGTADGTMLVMDINPGANPSYPHDLDKFRVADEGQRGRDCYTGSAF